MPKELPWSKWSEDEDAQLSSLLDLGNLAEEKAGALRARAEQLRQNAGALVREADELRRAADATLAASNVHRRGFYRVAGKARGLDPDTCSRIQGTRKLDNGSLVVVVADPPEPPKPPAPETKPTEKKETAP